MVGIVILSTMLFSESYFAEHVFLQALEKHFQTLNVVSSQAATQELSWWLKSGVTSEIWSHFSNRADNQQTPQSLLQNWLIKSYSTLLDGSYFVC